MPSRIGQINYPPWSTGEWSPDGRPARIGDAAFDFERRDGCN